MRGPLLAAALFLVLAGQFAAGTPAVCAGEANAGSDPWERVNRPVFWFNDKLDVYLLEPLARGYHRLMPDPAEAAMLRFLDNLRTPVDVANNLLQGKIEPALTHVGRFYINTTMGLGGLLDPAGSAGLKSSPEDFGQTLGRWGVPGGPYLVLPFLGPSSARDALGLGADSVLRVWPYFVDDLVWISAGAAAGVITRASLLEEIESAKRSSLDYYAFIRNAYLQRRQALVEDSPEKPQEDAEDLYYFDFEEDEED